VWRTDRQTDGFAIAYSTLSMLSRAKNWTYGFWGITTCGTMQWTNRPTNQRTHFRDHNISWQKYSGNELTEVKITPEITHAIEKIGQVRYSRWGYHGNSGIFRNLKSGPGGTFQVYIFKSVQILARIFFPLKLVEKNFTPKRGSRRKPPPKYAPAWQQGILPWQWPFQLQ